MEDFGIKGITGERKKMAQKASIMQIKKFFYNEVPATVFNEEWKKLDQKNKDELMDMLGTELEKNPGLLG